MRGETGEQSRAEARGDTERIAARGAGRREGGGHKTGSLATVVEKRRKKRWRDIIALSHACSSFLDNLVIYSWLSSPLFFFAYAFPLPFCCVL